MITKFHVQILQDEGWEWVHCQACGKKLFKVLRGKRYGNIEIKCKCGKYTVV